MPDTIAAISTALSPSGIGIIRISGKNSRQIADKVFRSNSEKEISDAKGYTMLYGRVFDANGDIDDAIALVFIAPKSYTGEDVVELSCHGGAYNLKRILQSVLSSGARIAEPGEFSRRAFLNGKMSLSQAEAVMDIISADGDMALRAALAGRDGALNIRIEGIKKKLVNLSAHLSAWSDFPEEDIEEVNEKNLYNDIFCIKEEVKALLDSYDVGKIIKNGINTVIAGKPNVGKSTLMNLLAGCKRSIVSEIAGTTRDIIEESVQLGGYVLRLSDTAGIRRSDDEIEAVGVEYAREKISGADLILAVFDASQPLSQEDTELFEELRGKNVIPILNKTDLDIVAKKQIIEKNIGKVIEISANDESSLKILSINIESRFISIKNTDPSQGILYNERQRQAVKNSLICIEEAFDAIKSKMTLDAVTVSLEDALNELYRLTGERVTEEVIDQVFHQFCVGK